VSSRNNPRKIQPNRGGGKTSSGFGAGTQPNRLKNMRKGIVKKMNWRKKSRVENRVACIAGGWFQQWSHEQAGC
jgi:hypothetical protein